MLAVRVYFNVISAEGMQVGGERQHDGALRKMLLLRAGMRAPAVLRRVMRNDEFHFEIHLRE